MVTRQRAPDAAREAQEEPRSISYIPGFDGLRAIAALIVIAFHLGLPGFGLGWTGVNLFFVISGFLITRILLAAKNDAYFFQRFYFRRSLRIFPIYYISFAVLLIVALARGWGVGAWPWYAFYLQNWKLALTGNPEFHGWFSHSWSLACEEQFYLIWPFVVWALSRRALTATIIGLILLGPTTRWVVITLTDNTWAVFAPLLCIVDALAWGAAGAMLYPRAGENRPSIRAIYVRWAFVATLGLCCGALALAPSREVFWKVDYLLDFSAGVVFFGLLGPLFLSVLLMICAGGLLTSALEVAPLRYLGRISYGLYLYHWPILLMTDNFLNMWPQAASLVGSTQVVLLKLSVTFIVAALSFELLERRLLALKERFWAPQA